MPFVKLIIRMLVFIPAILYAQVSGVYINEFLASNTSTNLSPHFSEYSDWIEIINSSTKDINIGGFYLTDDFTQPTKWIIPSGTIIHPNTYLLIWADGRDSVIHTNFKLNKEGGVIALINSDGSIIDSISYPLQKNDISYGRLADNISKWTYFTKPTPLTRNSSNVVSGFAPNPEFSIPGGFYNGSRTLILSTEGSLAEIRYFLNGTMPLETSPLYTEPIHIDSTTVIRARVFENGKLPSDVVTYSYFINEDVHLPVISIVTDPANFFDNKIGIYVTGTNGRRGDCDPTIRNLNQDWERPVNIEFYETSGEMRFNQLAGIKIFGGCSRTRYPQKSLALYARQEYGKGSFDYQLFPDKPIKKFETFLLRSSSDDQVFTMMRDGLAHTVVSKNFESDIQAYRPSVVFLNGKYWGIHNIREKVNDNYFKDNFGLELSEVNILERDPYQSYNIIAGSAASYNVMMDFMKSHDMTKDENYSYVQTQMDIKQYIDYEIGHIYLAERDWPGNNIRFWKASSGKYSKWRWVNYDMDQTFTFADTNALALATLDKGPSWPNPPWSTLLLRKLLENKNFKNEFIQRNAHLMNTTFKPEMLKHIIDSLKANIAPEIPRHIKKWGGQKDPDFHESWNVHATFNSVLEWEENINEMKVFADERPEHAWQNVIDKFSLSGVAQLSVKSSVPEAGKLTINSWEIADTGFSGKYFKDIPLTLQALPFFGYKFLFWKVGAAEYKTSSLSITLKKDTLLTACYEKENIIDSNLVIINEINYNSSDSFNPGDWIELYNQRDESLNISNWYVKDKEDNVPFVFPGDFVLSAHNYLVVCNDTILFRKCFPEIKNYIGNFNFGLSSKGETIHLFSSNNLFVDSVQYDNKPPWPIEADGTGATLELINPFLDNDSSGNWFAISGKHGTPGSINSDVTGIVQDEKSILSSHFQLYDNYPNPFNPVTTIAFMLPENQKVTLMIYDILGNCIKTIINEPKNAGVHLVVWDGKDTNGKPAASGTYFYQILSGKYMQTKKMLLLK